MSIDRVLLAGRLSAITNDLERSGDLPRVLCDACAGELPVDGVGLSLMARDDPGGRALLGASDEIGFQIEELQFSLGEGPCASAFTEARPVLVPDLEAEDFCARWPMFARGVQNIDVGALFAFPLQVGALGIGVLDCHRRRPGPMEDVTAALLVADTVTTVLVNAEAGGETLGAELFGISVSTHAIVHQATGALAARNGIRVTEALALLRAHAFRISRPLDEVAEEVLSGRLEIYSADGKPRGGER